MVQSQQQSRFMYGPQASAFGTLGTSTTVLGRVQNFTPKRSNKFVYEAGLGEGHNFVATGLGLFEAGGTVTYNPLDFDFLKHFIGPKSGSGTAGAPYVLTEDDVVGLTTGDIQAFTFEDANVSESTNMIVKYVGCVGSDFELRGSIGQKLECTASFVARHAESSTSATAYTAATGNAYMMLGGVWYWGGTPSALAGVQAFTFKFNNDLQESRDIDTRFIDIPTIGIRKYNFTLDIKMTSGLATTLINDFYSGTNTPATSGASPTANLEFEVALSTGSNRATFWLDHCSIDDLNDDKQLGGGLVILRVSGTARIGKGNTPIKWWAV